MSSDKTYTLAEIESHNKPSDLWTIIDNKVLDVTKFLKEHPGGEQTLLDWAGKDGTEAFDEVGHSQDAWDMIEEYTIGTVNEAEQKSKSKKKEKKVSQIKGTSVFQPLINNADLIVSFGILAGGLFMLYRLRSQK